jgi:Alpha/beta hydrolase
MVSFHELESADPAPYLAAAEVWRQAARSVRLRADEIAAARMNLSGAWVARAGQAAVDELLGLANRLDAANSALMSLDQALTAHYDGVRHAQAMLQDAKDNAVRFGLRVNGSGGVELVNPVRPGSSPNQPDTALAAVEAHQAEIAAQVQAALEYADSVDRSTVSALTDLWPVVAEGMDAVDVTTVPAVGTDPRQVREWWDRLTLSQQRWLIQNDPNGIGRLDGVPADARDQANRILLEQSQAALQAQADSLRAQIAALDDPANWNHSDQDPKGTALAAQRKLQAQLDTINRQLGGINAINGRLQQTGSGQDRGYLLLFDTNGNGHAIVATGNPDTAGNVVTYVPGTGARLDDIGKDIIRADRMAEAANAANPGQHSVGVLWLGYDAPQSLVTDSPDPSYAQHAESDLSRFQDGLRVTHDGPPSHNTMIGHSYGSAVIGFTARDMHLDANDVIFVGSAGVGVDNVSEMHGAAGVPMDGHHVWSTHIGNDIIQQAKNPADLADLGSSPNADGLPVPRRNHHRSPTDRSTSRQGVPVGHRVVCGPVL